MDKRTVLFVLLVGATFFGLNIFFNKQRDDKNRELLIEQEAKNSKALALKSAELEKRKAPLASLSLVDIYDHAEKTTLLSRGINLSGSTLTLAWETPLPSSIFVNGKEQNLQTKEVLEQAPALYASPGFSALQIPELPESGLFEVQLVTLGSEKMPQVYVGEIENGTFSLLEAPLSENALVLYKSSEGYVPIGFYAWRERVFVSLDKLPLFSSLVQAKPLLTAAKTEGEQKYYVLENAYQQLVFTNVGGALAEINLPLKSSKDEKSVVNEIGFDREIAAQSPENARFPGHPYFTADTKEEHAAGEVGGYYPLLRRGIWKSKSISIAPQYYALNIVSDYPEVAELVYTVKEFTPNRIVFESSQPHRKITKTYTLPPEDSGGPYIFDLELKVEGDARGLWLTSGVPEVEIMSNSSSPLVQYRLNRKGKPEVEKQSLPKAGEVVSVSSVEPDWVVNSNGYLGMIMDSLESIGSGYKVLGIAGNKVPTRLSILNPQYTPYPATKYPGYQVLLPLPSKGGTFQFRLYGGPFEEGVLKTVDTLYANAETGYNPDYSACRTFYGWFSFISKPFAKLLFIVMKFFYTLTGSWGLSIILLTVFLRILLYPLNAWSFKSMRRMQQISPQVQAIQAKHKKDPKKAQIEIMALYREKKVNPFTGCLPILIQIPFLIAMFDLLKSSFQLRGASFIPGWIDNLTAPDVIFEWQTPIFFIGNQLHLLPILLGVVMFFQQRLFSTAPKDPNQMTDQQRQQKAMGSIMTVVFTVMFYHFPSGLNIYWLSSMLLGMLQQLITNRILDKKKDEVEIISPTPPKKLAQKKGK